MFGAVFGGGEVGGDLAVDGVVLGGEVGETGVFNFGEILADVVRGFGEEVGGGGEKEGGGEGEAEEDVSCDRFKPECCSGIVTAQPLWGTYGFGPRRIQPDQRHRYTGCPVSTAHPLAEQT